MTLVVSAAKAMLTVKTSSGRISEYGFDFAKTRRGVLIGNERPNRRYLAIHTFRVQQQRVAPAQLSPAPSLPAQLLLTARAHIT